MINKSHIWFLTLASIIVVLSGYYVLVPTKKDTTVFKTNPDSKEMSISIKEDEALTALRISKEEEILKEINKNQETLLNASATVDEKNEAYDQIKNIHDNNSIKEKLEMKINKSFNVTSFIDLKDTNINVVIANKKDDYKLANNIIRTVNEELKDNYYVTVKFE